MLPQRRVLVVDDDRDIADTQALLLEALGQTVARAYDGATAIQLARTFAPDIVLLDLDMPGLTGLYVARLLRRIPELQDTRIIAHTGTARAGYRAAIEAAGFDGYAAKPMMLPELTQILTLGRVTANLGALSPSGPVVAP